METEQKIESLKEQVGQLASFANDYIGVISYKEQGIVRDVNERLAMNKIIADLQTIFTGLDDLKLSLEDKKEHKEEKKN